MSRRNKKPAQKPSPKPETSNQMKLYSFHAPEAMMNQLKALGDEQMLSMSALIRVSIQHFLKVTEK